MTFGSPGTDRGLLIGDSFPRDQPRQQGLRTRSSCPKCPVLSREQKVAWQCEICDAFLTSPPAHQRSPSTRNFASASSLHSRGKHPRSLPISAEYNGRHCCSTCRSCGRWQSRRHGPGESKGLARRECIMRGWSFTNVCTSWSIVVLDQGLQRWRSDFLVPQACSMFAKAQMMEQLYGSRKPDGPADFGNKSRREHLTSMAKLNPM